SDVCSSDLGLIGQGGKILAKHGQHYLPVAGHLQELLHARFVVEEVEVRAWIVHLGVEQEDLLEFGLAPIQLVNETIHRFALQRLLNRVQQRRFAGPVVTAEHDQRMGKIHNHRHMEVQIDENGMGQDCQIHCWYQYTVNCN